MVRRRKDPRWALVVAGATAVSAIGYYVYSKYRQNPATTEHSKSGVTPDTKVAIVVNKVRDKVCRRGKYMMLTSHWCNRECH